MARGVGGQRGNAAGVGDLGRVALLARDNRPQAIKCNYFDNVLYFFFPFAAALAKFSFTLNFTILLIKSKGMGLSNGNLTVPLPPL